MNAVQCGARTGKGTPRKRPAVSGGPCAWHDPRRKPEPRAWPERRRWQLIALLESGAEDDVIAGKLGCTANAVELARKRYNIAPRSKAIMTARAVARLLGIGCAKTITRWAASGWLKAHRAWHQGRTRVLTVKHASLFEFLENPEHWHRWSPERITDPRVREWALSIRAGVRFLTLSEVADRYFVQPATVHSWIEKGWLPAVRNGNHLVRESDLAGFELPRIGGRR